MGAEWARAFRCKHFRSAKLAVEWAGMESNGTELN